MINFIAKEKFKAFTQFCLYSGFSLYIAYDYNLDIVNKFGCAALCVYIIMLDIIEPLIRLYAYKLHILFELFTGTNGHNFVIKYLGYACGHKV